MQRGDSGGNVKNLQQLLKDAGFDPGPIDGIFGAQTESALRQFQRSNDLKVDGVAGSRTLDLLESGGRTEKSTTSTGGNKLRNEIADAYPHLVWALDHKELGPILKEAAEDKWDALKLQGAVQGTNWWKQTSANARQVTALRHTDPAEYKRLVETTELMVSGLRDQLGIHLSSRQLKSVVSDAVLLGMSEIEVRHALLDAGQIRVGMLKRGELSGEAAENMRLLEQVAQDHLIQLNDSQKQRWLTEFASGEQNIEGFANWAEQVTLAQMPYLQRFIDKGIPPGRALEPYKQAIAEHLELNAEQVDWSKDAFRSVLEVGEGENRRLATVSELRGNVRQRFAKQWGRTNNAKQAAAVLSRSVGDMFGRTA